MPRNIRFPGCQRAGRPMFMPADAGQILRQMPGIRLLLHPAHHAAQFLADLFDQVLGLHTALCQEVDLAAALRAHLDIGPLSEHVVRKLAHFSEFTLEGFLLMLCLRVYTRRFVRHVSWPMLGGMATALLDETIQLYVPGRTSSVRDVWIDFGGVIAGLFVALLLLLIVRGLTSFHAMKKENRRLRAERAELLRQQRADRINTADDRPESPDRREYL